MKATIDPIVWDYAKDNDFNDRLERWGLSGSRTLQVTQHLYTLAVPNNFWQANAKAKRSSFSERWFRAAEDNRYLINVA